MATPGENCDRHEREINRLRDQVRDQATTFAAKEMELVALQHDHAALAERLPPELPRWMGEVSTTLETLARGQNDVVMALRQGYVTVAELEVVREQQKQFATKSEFENLKTAIKPMREQQQQFATKGELETLKTELKPIVSTFWKAAALIGTALLAAVLGLIFQERKAAEPPPHSHPPPAVQAAPQGPTK